MMMRLVVVVLALLAAAKIWTQHQIYRSATEEALIAAYRDAAIAACRALPLPGTPLTRTEEARRVLAEAWATPASVQVVIGNSDVDVSIWQVDHAGWDLRFRHPQLILDAGEPRPIARCSYDVKLRRAAISTL